MVDRETEGEVFNHPGLSLPCRTRHGGRPRPPRLLSFSTGIRGVPRGGLRACVVGAPHGRCGRWGERLGRPGDALQLHDTARRRRRVPLGAGHAGASLLCPSCATPCRRRGPLAALWHAGHLGGGGTAAYRSALSRIPHCWACRGVASAATTRAAAAQTHGRSVRAEGAPFPAPCARASRPFRRMRTVATPPLVLLSILPHAPTSPIGAPTHVASLSDERHASSRSKRPPEAWCGEHALI